MQIDAKPTFSRTIHPPPTFNPQGFEFIKRVNNRNRDKKVMFSFLFNRNVQPFCIQYVGPLVVRRCTFKSPNKFLYIKYTKKEKNLVEVRTVLLNMQRFIKKIYWVI